jgi:TolB-like protein
MAIAAGLWLVLLAMSPTQTTASAKAAPEPIAVATWKNLGGDADLSFLELGAAETVTADLRRAGHQVVERAQLAEALAQVGTQARSDVDAAVVAGRVVGARSIVLGSVQRSGPAVRLVARLVVIETGEVSGGVVATGPLEDVFALQDQLVQGLFGRPPRPRPTTSRALSSYRRLGGALRATTATTTTTSPKTPSPKTTPKTAPKTAATLLSSLDAIVVDDPDFSYAADALSALEARLRATAPATTAALSARTAALLAVVDDHGNTPERRRAAARAAIDGLVAERRFAAAVDVSARVVAADIPVDVVDDVGEHAAATRTVALLRLRRTDAGLAAAERYLHKHPAGADRALVDAAVRQAIDERRSEKARRDDFAAELRELNDDVSSAGAGADARRSFAWKPCIAAKWSTLGSEMVNRCTRYLKHYGGDVDDDGVDNVIAAKAFIAWGHALRGDFEAAQAAAAALEGEHPGGLDTSGLRSVMGSWAVDGRLE